MDKRALIQRYKDAFPSMGVYLIRNRVNGRTHVEASTNVEGAINRHQFELRQGTHKNKALQSDWRAHGAEQFCFEVIDRVRQRIGEPDFDYPAELADLLTLWREEYGVYGEPNDKKQAGHVGGQT